MHVTEVLIKVRRSPKLNDGDQGNYVHMSIIKLFSLTNFSLCSCSTGAQSFTVIMWNQTIKHIQTDHGVVNIVKQLHCGHAVYPRSQHH